MLMGLMDMKKITVLFLILISSASLFSTSFGGREWRFVDKPAIYMDVSAPVKEISAGTSMMQHDEVHERVLRVNAKDYASYDPSPTLVKPPFKLIPN